MLWITFFLNYKMNIKLFYLKLSFESGKNINFALRVFCNSLSQAFSLQLNFHTMFISILTSTSPQHIQWYTLPVKHISHPRCEIHKNVLIISIDSADYNTSPLQCLQWRSPDANHSEDGYRPQWCTIIKIPGTSILHWSIYIANFRGRVSNKFLT